MAYDDRGIDVLDPDAPATKIMRARLGDDLRQAAAALTPEDCRLLVDLYYQLQTVRVRASNQKFAARGSAEPNVFVSFIQKNMLVLEQQIKEALGENAAQTQTGAWAMSIFGIGPVLTAGLLAYLDVEQSTTPSKFWSFAGLNPESKWLGKDGAQAVVEQFVPGRTRLSEEHLGQIAAHVKRRPEMLLRACQEEHNGSVRYSKDKLRQVLARRPWNTRLKVLGWKIGDSFVKISNNPKDDGYGQLYRERKALEVMRNEAGQFAQTAAQTLAERKIKDAETRAYYEAGKLPPGRIDLRARRVATKKFLADFWSVRWVEVHGARPMTPWLQASDPKHQHLSPPPKWPFSRDLLPRIGG